MSLIGFVLFQQNWFTWRRCGSPSDSFILKRLKDKAVKRCPQFTEDDEEFVGKIIRLSCIISFRHRAGLKHENYHVIDIEHSAFERLRS